MQPLLIVGVHLHADESPRQEEEGKVWFPPGVEDWSLNIHYAVSLEGVSLLEPPSGGGQRGLFESGEALDVKWDVGLQTNAMNVFLDEFKFFYWYTRYFR